MKNFLLNSNIKSRGIRNNNPFNLKKTWIFWKGETLNPRESTFESFSNLNYGLRAGALNILNKLKKGRTITSLMHEYAPSNENDTSKYIAFVSKHTGIDRNQKLQANRDTLFKLSKAIIWYENLASEKHLITDTDLNNALNLLSFSTNSNSTMRNTAIALTVVGAITFFYFTSKKNK